MGTEEYRGTTEEHPSGHKSQRNSGHRGTVGTKEQWAQRNRGHWGTVGTEEQKALRNSEEYWTHRNSRHRGTMGNSGHWGTVRKIKHKGTVDTEEYFLFKEVSQTAHATNLIRLQSFRSVSFPEPSLKFGVQFLAILNAGIIPCSSQCLYERTPENFTISLIRNFPLTASISCGSQASQHTNRSLTSL